MHLFRVDKILHGQAPSGPVPENREILQHMLHVAWPSILESFLIAMVGIIDTIMVSSLGAYAIAAVGLTTQPKFIGLSLFISLNVAVSALVARRKGEDDRETANRVLAQALMITLFLTVIVSIVSVVFADPFISMVGSAEDTHQPAVEYFQIIMGGMVFSVISLVINAAQRGAGNTRIAMWTNIISNVVNVVFNYLLIGGKFGFPALGIKGAAIATVIGTIVACGISIASMLRKENFIYIFAAKTLRFSKKILASMANLGSSTLAEQLFLRVGFLIFAVIIANLGTTEMAAHQIGMNFMGLTFSIGDGLSVASVTLVGQSLGMKRPDLAKIYGSVCQRVGLLLSGVVSLVFLFFGRYLFMLFSDDPKILDYGTILMRILMVVLFLQISQVIFTGCLRGAGDTRFTALVSLVSVAIIRPLVGYVLCYPLGLGLVGAWLGLMIDQSVRLLLARWRFKQGKWTKIEI